MRDNAKFLLHFLVLAVFFSFSGAAVYAQETSETANKSLENNLKIDTAKESTVRLVGLPGGGTGFFIAPDKIATNFHVVVMCKIGPIFAKLGHKETIWAIEGVMAFDAKSDIAILKVKGEGTPLPLADIETLQIGETVFLAGYPNLAGYKVTEGVVQDYTGAIEDYTYALELNPDDAEVYKKRGKAKAELGDDAGKIADYNQYLKRKSQNKRR